MSKKREKKQKKNNTVSRAKLMKKSEKELRKYFKRIFKNSKPGHVDIYIGNKGLVFTTHRDDENLGADKNEMLTPKIILIGHDGDIRLKEFIKIKKNNKYKMNKSTMSEEIRRDWIELLESTASMCDEKTSNSSESKKEEETTISEEVESAKDEPIPEFPAPEEDEKLVELKEEESIFNEDSIVRQTDDESTHKPTVAEQIDEIFGVLYKPNKVSSEKLAHDENQDELESKKPSDDSSESKREEETTISEEVESTKDEPIPEFSAPEEDDTQDELESKKPSENSSKNDINSAETKDTEHTVSNENISNRTDDFNETGEEAVKTESNKASDEDIREDIKVEELFPTVEYPLYPVNRNLTFDEIMDFVKSFTEMHIESMHTASKTDIKRKGKEPYLSYLLYHTVRYVNGGRFPSENIQYWGWNEDNIASKLSRGRLKDNRLYYRLYATLILSIFGRDEYSKFLEYLEFTPSIHFDNKFIDETGLIPALSEDMISRSEAIREINDEIDCMLHRFIVYFNSYKDPEYLQHPIYEEYDIYKMKRYIYAPCPNPVKFQQLSAGDKFFFVDDCKNKYSVPWTLKNGVRSFVKPKCSLLQEKEGNHEILEELRDYVLNNHNLTNTQLRDENNNVKSMKEFIKYLNSDYNLYRLFLIEIEDLKEY